MVDSASIDEQNTPQAGTAFAAAATAAVVHHRTASVEGRTVFYREAGTRDEIFGADGARAFARDLPDAEIHLLDAGHFALETHGGEIADLIRDFLGRTLS